MVLLPVLLTSCAAVIQITPISYQMPLDASRGAEDAKLSGNGRYVGFQSDSNFKRIGLDDDSEPSCLGNGEKNLWIRDLELEDASWSHLTGTPEAFVQVGECTTVDTVDIAFDHNGSSAVFLSYESGKPSLAKWTRVNATYGAVTWITPQFDSDADLHAPDGNRDVVTAQGHSPPRISASGRCVVFTSDAELADANATHTCKLTAPAESRGCAEVSQGHDQIYMTCDDGLSFTMVTGGTEQFAGPWVSGDGEYVTYKLKGGGSTGNHQTPIEVDGVQAAQSGEVFLYEAASGKREMITKNLGQGCQESLHKDLIIEKTREKWGADVAEAGGITTTSSWTAIDDLCTMAAGQGWVPTYDLRSQMGNTFFPSISSSGRFVAFNQPLLAADTFGTHRVAGTEAMTHPHVYLFDARLGMIWQVTREHIAGSPEYEYDLGAHNCVSPVGVAKSGSRRRNTLAAEDCADDPWKCCHVNSGTDVKGNQNAMISGDGNSIVWTSDFDNTFSNLTVGEDGGTVSWLTEVYHYHIPTSTVTRVTKTPTTVALGGHTELSISHDGSQATWKSKFDYNASEAVASNSYLQIFHAKITMGCGQASATNYHADPDVKVCCTWSDDIEPARLGTKAEVTLTLGLNQSAMIERVPFKTAAEVDRASFCSAVAADVHADVACALNIPPSLVTVDTSTEACSWASDMELDVTVKVTLHELGTGEVTDLPAPGDLADDLVAQWEAGRTETVEWWGDGAAGGAIWKGYLTQTLSATTAPSVVKSTVTEAPTPAPTAAPTPAPTAAPTSAPTAAPAASADATTKVVAATLSLDGLTEAGAKAIEPAIKASLAAKANVAESAVTITGYTPTGRRLAPARRLAGVDVQFEIEVPAAEADAMVDTVTAMEPAAVVTEIVAQVEKLSLEDELLAAEPGADLSKVTVTISEPVLKETGGNSEEDLNSAAGVAAVLLGALVLQ